MDTERDQLLKQYNVIKSIIELWEYLGKKRRLQIFLLFILMIISTFAEIISIGSVVPFLSALTNPEILMNAQWFHPIINILNINSPSELLLPLTIGFVIASIFSASIRILLLWVSTKLSASMGIQLREDIYKRALYQPYEVLISSNSSRLISIATEKIGGAISAGITQVLMLFSAFFTSSAIIITLLFINVTVAIVIFIMLGGGYILIGYLVRKKIEDNGNIIARNQPVAIRSMQEGLGGIRDIIINNSQSIFTRLYTTVSRELQLAAMQNAFLGNLPKILLEMLSILMIAILAYYLEVMASEHQSALPVLGALALGAQRLLPSLQQIYFSWSYIQSNQAILSEVVEQLKKPLPSLEQQIVNKNVSLDFNQKIILRNLSFHYKNHENLVLDNINLTILKGSKVGFIGETGSGKSTLIDIIMGLLVPSRGSLIVDKVTINEKNLKNWQANIAHVPQSIFLSDASIRENIAFGIPSEDIDLSRVKQAAKQAAIDDFIDSLPQKYETSVGERGVKLSGGQRQRLGIARALYKQASVIIFDEATSALDDRTEASVMKSINSLDKNLTILIVAHRLTTLKECDIIYKLENGKIIQSGSYKQIVGEEEL